MPIDQTPTVQVTVQKILSSGLSVRLKDGRTGLIRAREISWDPQTAETWRDNFHSGDTLQAVILTDTNGQLELSLRLAETDPWQDLHVRFPSGQNFAGIVVGVQPYGAFIELAHGITGLLHVSELPAWIRTKGDAIYWFWPNDHVRVRILKIDHRRRRISLGLPMSDVPREPNAPPTHLASVTLSPSDAPLTALELAQQGKNAYTIMVVEDDPRQNQALTSWLIHSGHRVISVFDAEDALAHLEHEQPDIVLIDLNLPDLNGIQAIRTMRERWADVYCVLMSGGVKITEHFADLEELNNQGVPLLIKPLMPADLLDILAHFKQPAAKSSASFIKEPAMPVHLLAALPVRRALEQTIRSARIQTESAQAILFALDPAQRQVQIIAENGTHPLDKEHIVNLIHSPVRDVAEEQLVVTVSNVEDAEALVRHLKPLLPFRACLGVPVPGKWMQQYALFFFFDRAQPIVPALVDRASAVALALSALIEREQFQTRANDIQRLALVGHLTSALTHEINHQLSPIGFVLSELETFAARIEELSISKPNEVEPEARQARAKLRDLAQGIRALTSTAQLFRQVTGIGKEEFVRLDEAVQNAIKLLITQAKRANTGLAIQKPPKLIFTRTQATQVQQVLINILLNAIQQIELLRRSTGGRIWIRLAQIPHEGESTLQIQVEDDGPGIHRNLWERIFELGFTTRGGEGSGLGLYISRSLIESLGGQIYVKESWITLGSIFVIELPSQK